LVGKKNIKRTQGQSNQNEAEQREIDRFNHQAAQQNIRAVRSDVEIDRVVASFKNETINLANQQSYVGGIRTDHINLSFVDDAKSQHVVLAVSLAQLHKPEMLLRLMTEAWLTRGVALVVILLVSPRWFIGFCSFAVLVRF